MADMVVGGGPEAGSLAPPSAALDLSDAGLADGDLDSALQGPSQDTLQRLDLRNNRLQLAPQLGGLTGLRALDLSFNLLMDVEALRPLTQLRALLLGLNCLHSLEPLRGLTRLEVLDCRSNQVADLAPLAPLRRLRALNVAGNQLASLPAELAQLTGLSELSLRRNALTSLRGCCERGAAAGGGGGGEGRACALPPGLVRLSLAANKLPSMVALAPLRGLARLADLQCAGNPACVAGAGAGAVREAVLRCCPPGLTRLDDQPVTAGERQVLLMAPHQEQVGLEAAWGAAGHEMAVAEAAACTFPPGAQRRAAGWPAAAPLPGLAGAVSGLQRLQVVQLGAPAAVAGGAAQAGAAGAPADGGDTAPEVVAYISSLDATGMRGGASSATATAAAAGWPPAGSGTDGLLPAPASAGEAEGPYSAVATDGAAAGVVHGDMFGEGVWIEDAELEDDYLLHQHVTLTQRPRRNVPPGQTGIEFDGKRLALTGDVLHALRTPAYANVGCVALSDVPFREVAAHMSSLAALTRLTRLELEGNGMAGLPKLHALMRLPVLRSLDLGDNPVCRLVLLRPYAALRLPGLLALNDCMVTKAERAAAQRMFGGLEGALAAALAQPGQRAALAAAGVPTSVLALARGRAGGGQGRQAGGAQAPPPAQAASAIEAALQRAGATAGAHAGCEGPQGDCPAPCPSPAVQALLAHRGWPAGAAAPSARHIAAGERFAAMLVRDAAVVQAQFVELEGLWDAALGGHLQKGHL